MDSPSSATDRVFVTGAGHDPSVWRGRVEAGPRWTLAELVQDVAQRDQIVVLSAHPDDESIGAGRLLSAWGHSGRGVRAVLATAGEACVDAVGPRPAGLPERRVGEWRCALSALGVEPGPVLGLPDGGLTEVEDRLVDALRSTLRELEVAADRLLLLAPHPLDPHPDHRAAGRAAARVAADLAIPVWFFGVWLTYWSDPSTDLGGTFGTVITDAADERARQQAVACFESQLEELIIGIGPVVAPEMLTHHDRQLLVVPSGSRR